MFEAAKGGIYHEFGKAISMPSELQESLEKGELSDYARLWNILEESSAVLGMGLWQE